MKKTKTAITTMATCAIFTSSALAQNLLLDGSFESPVIPANTYQYNLTPDFWTITDITYMFNGSVYNGSYWPLAQDGQQYFNLGNGSISQNFAVSTPGQFNLSFYDNALGVPGLNVTLENSSFQTVASSTLTLTAGDWQEVTIPLDLTADTYTLTFSAQNIAGSWDPLIDNVSITTVPEPSSALLGAVGFAVIMYRRFVTRKSA